MSVLGWFLFAAISVIGASIYWNQTRGYKAYFNEAERTNDENRQCMEESRQRVERLIALQRKTNDLLREVLGELRQKTELKEFGGIVRPVCRRTRASPHYSAQSPTEQWIYHWRRSPLARTIASMNTGYLHEMRTPANAIDEYRGNERDHSFSDTRGSK